MNRSLEPEKVYARALDPVHIGAGGYRLGRADNTIVREPSTDIPKIPGTSIAGVTREFYTAYLAENEFGDKSAEEKRKRAEEKAKSIFGDENKKGVLRFYDGQILFFPVSSVRGTVWITTEQLFNYWCVKDEKISYEDENKVYAIRGELNGRLNLGWLLFEVNSEKKEDVDLPDEINEWIKRAVIVPENLFSPIVNDNLEVRTSVRIDPETGTAVEGALFTYEAIPRGTIFGFEIAAEKDEKRKEVLKAVSPYLKYLGIGGMVTRGFGRLELAAEHSEDEQVGTDVKP